MPSAESPGDPRVRIVVADLALIARLEWDAAPRSCAALCALLPLERTLLQARWSGESGWIPLAPTDLRLGGENEVHRPVPGQILLYAGTRSEPEILIAYGQAAFACRRGPLYGNHVLTISHGVELLGEIGRRLVWQGGAPVRIDLIGERLP